VTRDEASGRQDAPWHFLSPEHASWREWDDGLVIYTDTTGHTHHLSPIAAEVVLTLLRQPGAVPFDELCRQVDLRVEAPPDISLAAEVERVLAELQEWELAAPD
jgi:PqqD family protein of HPr-rel-A system